MGFLTGKTAIITGAGRAVLKDGSCGSIGYGIATAYAKEGANLVITGRNVKKLEAAKQELESLYGIKVLTVQADVCARHLFAEQRSAHVADARRACCMRTGRTDHHRPHHIENIDHGNPVLSGFLRKKHIISAAEKRVKFPRPRCDY